MKRTAQCQSVPSRRVSKCPVLFSRHRFVRIFSPCSRQLSCSPPRRTTSPRVTRSTRPSTTRPTISPRSPSTTAQSIANQALQTTVGYSTKSNVSTTIAGATPADLRGTTSFTNAIASSNVLYSGAAGGTTAEVGTNLIGGISGAVSFAALTNNSSTVAVTTASTVIAAAVAGSSNALAATVPSFLSGKSINVNGHTVTFTATVP